MADADFEKEFSKMNPMQQYKYASESFGDEFTKMKTSEQQAYLRELTGGVSPIPGMEKLSPADAGKAPQNPIMAGLKDTQEDATSMPGAAITLAPGNARAGIRQTLDGMARMTRPVERPPDINGTAQPHGWDEKMGGASDIIRGTGRVMAPALLAPSAALAPLATVGAVAGGAVGAGVAGIGARAANLGPGASDLAQDAGGMVGGGVGAKVGPVVTRLPLKEIGKEAVSAIPFLGPRAVRIGELIHDSVYPPTADVLPQPKLAPNARSVLRGQEQGPIPGQGQLPPTPGPGPATPFPDRNYLPEDSQILPPRPVQRQTAVGREEASPFEKPLGPRQVLPPDKTAPSLQGYTGADSTVLPKGPKLSPFASALEDQQGSGKSLVQPRDISSTGIKGTVVPKETAQKGFFDDFKKGFNTVPESYKPGKKAPKPPTPKNALGGEVEETEAPKGLGKPEKEPAKVEPKSEVPDRYEDRANKLKDHYKASAKAKDDKLVEHFDKNEISAEELMNANDDVKKAWAKEAGFKTGINRPEDIAHRLKLQKKKE